VFGYNAVTDAKSQPSAAFLSLGGEEWVEDTVKIFRGNPRIVIRKSDPYIPLIFLGFDGELSAAVGLGYSLFGV